MGYLLQHSDEIVDTDFSAGISEEGGELGVEVLQMLEKIWGWGRHWAEIEGQR